MHHHALPWLHPILVVLAIAGVFYGFSNFGTLKKLIVGRPMRTSELKGQHTKLFWLIALPILAADLYSSVAYGPESGMTELAGLGPSVRWLILPITLSTVILLMILITSYIMGVTAYPTGGGAYAIAKDNFRRPWASLIAANSLLIDYVLTVAVSVSAGVQAVASAYPVVQNHEVTLSVLCILIILFVNLRGVTESATIFAWPTIVFAMCMVILIVTGFVDEFRHGFVQPHTPPFGRFPAELTTVLILKAFSSACSALTGIETISNAVPVFREPQDKSAIKAYLLLGAVTAVTLIGFSYHLYVKGIAVNPNNTMLSQLAAGYYGHGPMYQILIWATFIVLVLAANSTFTGFPQLAALVAADGFLPRALMLRGDRLGYSNGMIVLAAFAALLIEIFSAQTNALIPLYAIGVFVSFTVAQLGLVIRWMKHRVGRWRLKLIVNLVGSIITTLVAVIFAVTKFTGGAWVVLIVLPILLFMSVSVRKHYDHVVSELKIDVEKDFPVSHHVTSVVLVSGVHRVVRNTIAFAKSIHTDVVAMYVGFDDESIEQMKSVWEEWGNPVRLITMKNEYRSLIRPLSEFVKMMETWEGGRPERIHLIIPQFIPKRWWQNILHNQTSLLIRAWVLRNKDVVVTTVPYHLIR